MYVCGVDWFEEDCGIWECGLVSIAQAMGPLLKCRTSKIYSRDNKWPQTALSRIPDTDLENTSQSHFEHRCMIKLEMFSWFCPFIWWCSRKDVCVYTKSLQLCQTLCNSMDGTPPNPSVYGILQARILKWIPCPHPGSLLDPRNQTCISYVSCIGRQVLYHECHLWSPQEG